MAKLRISVKFQRLHPEAHLPRRWSNEAVGYDLHAYLIGDGGRPIKRIIAPNYTLNIPTGIAVETPPGYFIFVCPRSGLGKHSISITNSPGLIDPDYRGEIMVLMYNGSYQNFYVEHDMRIAQLVVMPITPISIVEVKELTRTQRGTSGFGSTGT